MNYKIYNNDCLTQLDLLEANSIDSIVTDPPYELNFMGKGWDNAGISFQKETWEKCLRVLKSGGYLLAFGGSRTFHRIAVAIEDAGFEIRDTIMWLYGSGFPKSMNIGLAVDKKNGVESKVIGTGKSGAKETHTNSLNLVNNPFGGEYEIKEAQNKWQGWGTALKPSFEPIIIARKPFKGSLVDNVIKWGVGGLNIDECRVGSEKLVNKGMSSLGVMHDDNWVSNKKVVNEVSGRFPANTILTYDQITFDEVCGAFPNTKSTPNNDSGSASRYFYCAKASKKDRDEGLIGFEEKNTMCDRNPELASANMPQNRSGNLRKNIHPTVKPTELMQYLIRLVNPKGATILDPFMGSGSTGKAVMYENKERQANYNFIGIELDKEYCDIAEARIQYAIRRYRNEIKEMRCKYE